MKKLQYLLTTVWGLLTPAFAFDGAQSLLNYFGKGKDAAGASTPAEYFMFFLLVAACSVLAYILFDFFFSASLLPKDGKRFRHFLINLILYAVLIPVGWAILAFLSSVV